MPELEAGVVSVPPARLGRLLGAREQPVDVDPEQRGRDDPERRQRRVAAADRRLAGEAVPEAALLRQDLQRGARVRDRDEPLASPAGLLPEVVRVRARLERRARLRGGDEQRALEIDLRLERPDRPRVRRVEDVERGGAERPPQHLGGEARAAHPEQDDRVEPLLRDRVREGRQLPDPLAHLPRLVQPAEPLRLVGAGPDGGVALPDPVDELATLAHALTSSRFDRTPSSSCTNESANFCTPSSSSVSVTSS